MDQNDQRVFDASVNRLFVVANESYEDFARAMQTEYEEDCGVTFGQVPITALAKLTHVVDGEERPIGLETAEAIRTALVLQGMLVPHPLLILGYSRFNFVRASSILNCQSTPRCLALVLSAQIPISAWSKGSSPMRRSVRH